MVRRFSAFRIAIGGLSFAVVLCLLAAVSFVQTDLRTVDRAQPAEVKSLNPRHSVSSKIPIRVATVGDVGDLLEDGTPSRPVPEAAEYTSTDHELPTSRSSEFGSTSAGGLPEEWVGVSHIAGSEDASSIAEETLNSGIGQSGVTQNEFPSPGRDAADAEAITSVAHPFVPAESAQADPAQGIPASADRVQAEIDQLRAQVDLLTQHQLENQIAEIRHSEQLLTAHQSHRLLESLQKDVDDLKLHRSSAIVSSEQATIGVATEVEDIEQPSLSESELLTDVTVQSDQTTNVELANEQPAVESDAAPMTDVRQSVLPLEGAHVRQGAASAAVLVSEPRVRYAPSDDHPGRYDVDADDATMTEFVTKLGPVAGWNLVAGPRLDGKVSCRWTAVDLQQALTEQLKAHGLTVRESGEFVVIETIPEVVAAVNAAVATPLEEQPPISLELETDPPEEETDSSIYDQTTGILIQPKLPPYAQDRKHPRIFARSDAMASHVQPALPARRVTAQPASRPTDEQAAHVPTNPGIRLSTSLLKPSGPPSGQSISEAPLDLAKYRVEATVLEVRPLPGTPAGVANRTLSVLGQGPCPRCGQDHTSQSVSLGHAANGWFELHDGVQCAVTSMDPEAVISRLQESTATSVTSTPDVEVVDRQYAELALTEQPGFRRQILLSDSSSREVPILQGGVRLAIRPLNKQEGGFELGISNHTVQSIATDATSLSINPIIQIPLDAGQCLVVGGLYYENISTSSPKTRAKQLSSLLRGKSHDRNTHEVVIVVRVSPLIDTSNHAETTSVRGTQSFHATPPRIVPPALAPQLMPPTR